MVREGHFFAKYCTSAYKKLRGTKANSTHFRSHTFLTNGQVRSLPFQKKKRYLSLFRTTSDYIQYDSVQGPNPTRYIHPV